MEINEYIRKVFKIFDKIPEPLNSYIVLFHVFYDFCGPNILFKTLSDQMFGLGSNKYGVLGLGHDHVVEEPQHIPELSDQNIQVIFNGSNFLFAVNTKNEVFGWGLNERGQLGTGYYSSDILIIQRPKRLDILNESIIDEISCGHSHALCLTSGGEVYGWGDNECGQVGNGTDDEVIVMPTLLESLSAIKSISCSNQCSLALTKEGNVFIWGCEPGDEQKYYKLPTLVSIANVKAITLSITNIYFLTNDGLIYFCGNYYQKNDRGRIVREASQKISDPQLIGADLIFDSITSYDIYNGCFYDKSLCAGLSNGKVFQLRWNNLIETKFQDYFGFYGQTLNLTFKTVKLKKLYVKNHILISLKFIESSDYIQKKSRFEGQHENITEIGSGNFGTVFKVKDKFDGSVYCIKRIKDENYDQENAKMLEREIKIMAQLCGYRFLVKYFSIWWEDGCTFIKMELCDTNFRTILEIKPKVFQRKIKEPMNTFELFISCLLFKDIVECVHYFHQNDIIHRDLKPENILIRFNTSKYEDILRVCDFGLSVVCQATEQDQCCSTFTATNPTHTDNVGTIGYIAPEVKAGNKYSTKADIYGLGVIAKELFDFKVKSSRIIERYKENECIKIIENLVNLIETMTSKDDDKRPNSKDIFNTIKTIFQDFNFDCFNEFEKLEQTSKSLENELGEKAMFFIQFFEATTMFMNRVKQNEVFY